MKQIGSYLADTLEQDGQIKEQERAIYAYLFDYLFEAIIFDVIIFILGILFRQCGITVCFLIVSGLLRHFAGGFHANTRWMCTILSYGSYLIVVYLTPVLAFALPYAWLWIISYAVSWGLILPVAPVDTKNKRLSDEQRTVLFHRCILTCILTSIVVCFFWYKQWMLYLTAVTLCLLQGVVSVYVGIWKNRRNL